MIERRGASKGGSSSPRSSTERLATLGPTRYQYQTCTLDVIGGPETGRSLECEASSIRIGSSPECELVLADPAVSRVHATLELTSRGYCLRDLDSRNGTLLDGVLVQSAYPRHGSVIELGRSRVRVGLGSREIQAPPSLSTSFHGLVGRSAPMRQLFTALDRLAPTQVSVLITGETGAGKELVARALHAGSKRQGGPFVVFDCANTDSELIRSELFGHQAGAFTGASSARAGAFERAHGGTFFLDEIGELPTDLQPRLLRVLQERQVTRLGADAPRPVDVRVVAATHRDLLGMVRQGSFREDLYYRLAQLVLEVPALSKRPEDVAPLAQKFLADAGRGQAFTDAALELLGARRWRGNVRELKGFIEVVSALHPESTLDVEQISESLSMLPSEPVPSSPSVAVGTGENLDEVEREAIIRAFNAAGGNLSQAARALGLSRPTLRERLRRYGLKPSP